MLKRKLDESVDDSGGPETASTSNGQSESDDSNCSNGSTDALAPEVASGPPPPKRMKKRVNFQGVSVFYFPRRQGFTCVPSEGGSTLGMSEKHTFMRDFSLSDYTKEQKRIHRTILAEQRRQGKMFPSPLLASSLAPLDNEEDVSSGSESDSEYDDYYFLQPLPIRQRRVLLRTAGVKKIDNEEKDECRDIRVSRNVCGCDCRLFCDPATCSCSLAGIQCQVDRLSFPCGCTKDGCSNPAGRIEFNPIRVRTHFIHTLMRLELERTDSQCPDGKPAASTSSFSHRSSTAIDEIDVVGANGTESGEASPDNSNDASEDCCSGATADASSSEGVKVLKSRLKTKKEELIDLNMFNSNERGSCRDCQNTDMCNVMMHDVKFSMVNQQQRQHQQQRAITAAMGPQPGYPGPQGSQLQQHHHMSLSSGLSLLHPPAMPAQQQPSSQHMLLFNDGEDEVYRAENTSSMYFDNDEGPYSEISDTSPDVLENASFSSVSQANFQRKFHLSPSQMFPSSISGSSSSSNGAIHSQSLVMPKQMSLLNSSCIQSLPVNGGCGVGPSTTSCSNVGLEKQQQQCGLLTHTQQQSAAAVPSRSLLRPPFLPPTQQISAGLCVGAAAAAAAVTSIQELHSQNGLLPHTHLDNSLEMEASDSSLMLQGATPGFQSKFDLMETQVQASQPSPSYKLDSPMRASNSYSPGSSAVSSTDYLSQASHVNFSDSATVAFVNTSMSAVKNENSPSFQSLQTTQIPSWSTSLASPTLRECLGLDSSSPEAASSSTDQRASQLEISTYQHEPEACTVTLSPSSPNSSTITYATMTTTTRDLLAAHCPGISSHMDGRPEATTCTLKDSPTSFSSYHITDGADTSSLVGTSQNLLYDLSYSDTNTLGSCDNVNITSTTLEQNIKQADSLMNNFSTESVLPLLPKSSFPKSLFASPPTVSSTFTSEPSTTTHLYSAVTSTCLPLVPACPISSTSSPGTSQTYQEDADIILPTSQGFSKECSLISHGKEMPSLSSASEMEEGQESLNETCVLQKDTQSVSVPTDLFEPHLDMWNTKYDLKEHKDEEISWKEGNKEQLSDVQCGNTGMSSEIQDIELEQDRNYEVCATDSEVVSSLSSSTAQSTTSSSASSSSSASPTSEEEKEQTMNQGFGEIIKESIVEMVLV